MSDKPKALLRIDEVARLMRVTDRTVRRWRHDGKVPTIKTPSGRTLIPYGALTPWAADEPSDAD